MRSETLARPVVDLRAARKSYRMGHTAVAGLDDVDLRVHAGEYVAVVGASGSGKSTLLNVLGTLDTLDAGEYVLDGQAVETMDDEHASRLRSEKIGFVFQSFHLLPLYTALENVELPMIYAGVPRAERRCRAEEALRHVGLEARAEHLPAEMSGGQQQRVAIARALVNGPRLVLADEPTGALDSESTADILAIFDELSRAGTTIVMVTHDREVAARTERIVVMRDARIVSDELMHASRPRTA